MRRALAILLLLFLGTPMLLPLLAASGNSDAGLPACCRRNGAHHCAMTAAERTAVSGGALGRRVMEAPHRGCPYMPMPTTPVSFHVETSALGQASNLPLPAASHREGAAQTEVRRRIAAERARQKRGPPASQSQALSL